MIVNTALFAVGLRDIAHEHFALVIDGAPQVHHLAVEPDVHFINMPTPMTKPPHMVDPRATDLPSKHRAERVPPQPRCLVQKSAPRSKNRSPTFRKLSGNRMYNITA